MTQIRANNDTAKWNIPSKNIYKSVIESNIPSQI